MPDDDPVVEAWLRHALERVLQIVTVAVAAVAYSLSVDAEGAARFQSNLCQPDTKMLLILGSRLFHACQYATFFLYHLVDAAPVWPATISFTIRRGAPRFLHHALWLAGWFVTATAIARSGTSVAFCAQMVATGVVSVIIFPVGRGVKSDQVHVAGATLYILDHHFLLRLMSVPLLYCIGYYVSFAALAIGVVESKRLERAAGLPDGFDEGPRLWAALDRVGLRRRHWWARFLVMVSEYAAFTFFVAGFVAELPADCGSAAAVS